MQLLQAHEPARLTALAEYGIVGTEREGAFEELVQIARRRFETPMAAISFVDARRWWPKAIAGYARCSLPRAITFCHHALESDDVLEIADARFDARFAGSPLVESGPRVRFYAGAPLRDGLGYALGTFAIFADEPRTLDRADTDALREFARLAFQLVELRRAAGRADLDRTELERRTRSLALLEALLSAVSEAADLPTALRATARRIGDLTGWRVRGVWRTGNELAQTKDGALAAQAHLERRAILDGDGASVAIPVLAGDEVVAVLTFDVGTPGPDKGRALLAAVASVVQPLGALVRRRRIEEQLRASEMKLRSVTETARDGIVTLARDGTIVYANPSARIMFGRDEMRGLPLGKLVAGFGLDMPDGGVPMERWATHASGRRFPVELSWAEWSVDRSGYVTAIVRDVSERFEVQAEAEAAQRRLAFLFRATSELLEQPLSTEALVATVAKLVLPQLGDFCIVDLVEGDEHLRRVAAAPGHEQHAATLDTTPAFAPTDDSLIARVMRTGQPFLFSPSDGGAAGGALDLASAHAWARAGWRACLIVPLIARNHTVGAITLVSFQRGYGKDELALAQELGHRVAVALDNAHLYDEARAAVRVRDDVLAIVSHDLRNPLSTILTSTGRLLEKLDDEESGTGDLRAPLERCQRAARRMTHMISDLVDAASLETGTLSLDQRDNEMGRVMSDAIDLLQPLADARELRLLVDVEGALHALCDRERIVQVLSNLVGNAIKFTPSRGTIRVQAALWGDMVRVSVSDDGPGIAPDDLPRIFDRYWHQAKRESRQGAGLGLYIAKGIVENHGGRIWVDSIVGRGSTFYFTLPSVAVAVEASA